MANMIQKQIKRLFKKITHRAKVMQTVIDNYQSIYYTCKGNPISDAELRIDNLPSIYDNPAFAQCLIFTGNLGKILGFRDYREAFTSLINRKVARDSFDNSIKEAVISLEKEFEESLTKYNEFSKRRVKKELKSAKYWLAEHLATPYENTSSLSRVPYYAGDITSNQLRNYLGEMEKINPSERFCGGVK